MFVPLCLGVLEAGVIVWTQGALQSAASLSARCAAIAGADCSSVPQYVVATAESWTYPGVITAGNVTPPPHTTCLGGVLFMVVTITTSPWAGLRLSSSFNTLTLTSVAYYPMPISGCN